MRAIARRWRSGAGAVRRWPGTVLAAGSCRGIERRRRPRRHEDTGVGRTSRLWRRRHARWPSGLLPPRPVSEDRVRAALDPFLESYVRAFRRNPSTRRTSSALRPVHKLVFKVDFPRWLDGSGACPRTNPCLPPATRRWPRTAVDRIQTDGMRSHPRSNRRTGTSWMLLCGTPPEDGAAPIRRCTCSVAAGLSDSRKLFELTMRWALLVIRTPHTGNSFVGATCS